MDDYQEGFKKEEPDKAEVKCEIEENEGPFLKQEESESPKIKREMDRAFSNPKNGISKFFG